MRDERRVRKDEAKAQAGPKDWVDGLPQVEMKDYPAPTDRSKRAQYEFQGDP